MDTQRKEEVWRAETVAREATRQQAEEQKQNRHMEGAKEHKKYVKELVKKERISSTFSISVKELKQIIESHEGEWEAIGNKWKVKLEYIVGLYYDDQGYGPFESDVLMAIPSKTGLHAYPGSPLGKR